MSIFAKDMNLPGFRPGHAPLAMVEAKVDAGYLDMALNEHLINKAMHECSINTEINYGELMVLRQSLKEIRLQ